MLVAGAVIDKFSSSNVFVCLVISTVQRVLIYAGGDGQRLNPTV